MRAIYISVDLLFRLRVLRIKMHIINLSNCTVNIVKFSLDLIPCFWPIFVDFQNEADGLCVNHPTDKDLKQTSMVL